MDLMDAITAFVRTAERGGFAAAARDLGTSQPHVTRAVQQLEARLGAPLLHRTTRRVTLTEAGAEYLEHCRQILAAVEQADHAVGERARTLSGRLRVFAPVSIGRLWLLPWIGQFMARHTSLEVELVLDDRPRDLVQERLDVGIAVGELPDSSLRVRRLGEVERVVVAKPAYWRQHGTPRQPADLSQHQALIFAGPITLDRLRLQRAAQTVDVALQGRFRTNSSEAIEEAALQGLGLLVAPTWLVGAHLASGQLKQVLVPWRIVPALAVSAIYPATRAPTEKVRRFIDGLVAHLHTRGSLNPAAPG
jgi:DNA-binding transcriptional LysR family regulator